MGSRVCITSFSRKSSQSLWLGFFPTFRPITLKNAMQKTNNLLPFRAREPLNMNELIQKSIKMIIFNLSCQYLGKKNSKILSFPEFIFNKEMLKTEQTYIFTCLHSFILNLTPILVSSFKSLPSLFHSNHFGNHCPKLWNQNSHNTP